MDPHPLAQNMPQAPVQPVVTTETMKRTLSPIELFAFEQYAIACSRAVSAPGTHVQLRTCLESRPLLIV